MKYLFVTALLFSLNALAHEEREDFRYQALKFCDVGDTCVAVKTSCHEWTAVRDIYLEDAKAFFNVNKPQEECFELTPPPFVPVAVCSPSAKKCTLTGIDALTIDPRIKVR